MGTAYSDQSGSASAYNSSPPPDDGTTVAANKITWANSKSKLGDPVKAYADAINTALLTTLNFGSTQQTTNYTTQASDNMTTIEIPSGSPTIKLGTAATMTKNYVVTVTNIGTGAPVIALQTGTDTLDGTANGTFTFPTGSATSSTSFTFKVNNGATGYYTEKIGGKSPQIVGVMANVLTPIVDSGSATSLSLKTNNGTVGLQILDTASANRNITITGSNGGNPTIATTNGNLAISPNTVFGQSIGIASTPAGGGKGIQFLSVQSASTDPNNLDDYAEGTWTPSVGGSATYNQQSGVYTKIGRLVIASAKLQINSLGTGSAFNVTGIPVPASTSLVGFVSYWNSLAIAPVFLAPIINGSTIQFNGATAANASLTQAVSLFGNSAEVDFSLVYFSA